VVHLAPDRESFLPDLLQPHARIPVQAVTETVELERNRAYIIPPGSYLASVDSHLRLASLDEKRHERGPIDHFFRTLSVTHDGQAVGVVLTGTGSDGALGIKAIKEHGGMTIAQDPEDAEYDGMPRCAIATGMIDLVLRYRTSRTVGAIDTRRTGARVGRNESVGSDGASPAPADLTRSKSSVRCRATCRT
jgi:two-component system CheB/CheR fusion protein